MAASATFHQFTQLPPEIRNMIWEMSLEALKPQIVYARKLDQRSHVNEGHYSFRYTVPSLLHACRESRNWAKTVYEQTFSCHRRGSGRRLPRSYVWFNFDTDMVEVKCSDIMSRFPQAKQIRHLRIIQLYSHHPTHYFHDPDYAVFSSLLNLRQFTRLRRLHIFTNGHSIGCEPVVFAHLKKDLACGVRILDAFTGKSRDSQNFRDVAWEEEWHLFGNNKSNFAALALGATVSPVKADEPIDLPRDKSGRKLNPNNYLFVGW